MKGYVYVIGDNVNKKFKIGSAKYPSTRLKQLQTGNPINLVIVCRIPTDNMKFLETELHLKYKHRKIVREWFLLTWDDLADLRALSF